MAASGHIFVEACPGAGKTRAIVARYLERASRETRQGVALLSFTNAAIDEARARCGGRSDLLHAPHFVGTFDAFINRFVTTPVFVATQGQSPDFVESWSRLEHTDIHVFGMSNGLSVSLDSFNFDEDGRASLRLTELSERGGLKAEAATYQVALEVEAGKRRLSFLKSGFLACSASRLYARLALAQPITGKTIRELLAARFAEIIIDEAQDSDPEELAILESLRDAGVSVVMVADLDQSIFEFRNCDPEAVRTFAATLGTGTRLSGNYRSTPAICDITASLRAGDDHDSAVGSNRYSDVPIIVQQFKKFGDLPSLIAPIAAKYALDSEEVIVLAHAQNHAAQAAGGSVGDPGSTRIARVARAALAVRSASASLREKRDAITSVERVLLDLLVGVAPGSMPIGRACEQAGLRRRWLTVSAGRLVAAFDPRATDRLAYASSVREWVESLVWPNGGATISTVGTLLKAPKAEKWDVVLGEQNDSSLRCETIHSFKGREAPGVALVLPKSLRTDESGRSVLDCWEQGVDSEARRVLYVGASRAERLLVLAVHESHVDRVTAVLSRDGVSYAVAA